MDVAAPGFPVLLRKDGAITQVLVHDAAEVREEMQKLTEAALRQLPLLRGLALCVEEPTLESLGAEYPSPKKGLTFQE